MKIDKYDNYQTSSGQKVRYLLRHNSNSAVVRALIWALVIILIGITLFPFLKPRYIFYMTLNDPLLKEFRRCRLVSYDFDIEHHDPLTLKTLYTRKYLGINLFYLDTLSRYGIQYEYTIYVELSDYKIKRVWFYGTELSASRSVGKIIGNIESDSALVELIKISGVNKCYYDRSYFVFHDSNSIIRYDGGEGIDFFKLSRTPERLKYLHPYSDFLKMTAAKGFIPSDFDSVRFLKIGGRVQGFMKRCCTDFVEVGSYGVTNVDLKWLSIPDTINPLFLQSQIRTKLLATGLDQKYLDKAFKLIETRAGRDADYHKVNNKIIESSRITGFFKYQWVTGTWLDKVHGGLKIGIFFTYFMDQKTFESARIGTSPDNWYDQIPLHPIETTISLDDLKRLAPNVDTAGINYTIDLDGRIWLLFVIDKYEYKVDIESGAIKKGPHIHGMRCFIGYDRRFDMKWNAK